MIRCPLGIVVCGEPPPEVASRFGPFVDWFAELLRERPVSAVGIDAKAPRLPGPKDFAGFVITGSPASVAAPEPWMSGIAELLHQAKAAGTPVLGVCFGHQLLAFAAGGEVIENPTGWEMGTYEVELLPAAAKVPLLGHIEEARFSANFSHRDAVVASSLPADVEVLAKNARTDVQALAWGEASLGVQFHPEFSAAITRAYIEVRKDDLAADAEKRKAAEDRPEALLDRVTECPDSAALVDRFVSEYVLRA